MLKNKIFISKRLRKEVISDGQVMCPNGNFESDEMFDKVALVQADNFEDKIILRRRRCNTQYFNQ